MVRPIRTLDIEDKRNARTGIRVRNSKIKRKRIHMNHRQIFLVIVMLFLFMGSGIGYVWSNFEGTQIGYNLSRLKKEELKLREMNQKLRLELATVKSPQYLEEVTRNLGLKEAPPDRIVILP
ncbi:MAG: cell division protein FtsL [Deltaproteobacteria bacterium]|nr:cell division protein FtsL [Deltaproteobacteria bacterium]